MRLLSCWLRSVNTWWFRGAARSTAILDAAQGRGELRAGANVALAVNMLVGAFYAQYLAGDPSTEDWSEKLVEALLEGLAIAAPESVARS